MVIFKFWGSMWRVKTVTKFKNSFFPVLIYWNNNRIHLNILESRFGPPPTKTVHWSTTKMVNWQLRIKLNFVLSYFHSLKENSQALWDQIWKSQLSCALEIIITLMITCGSPGCPITAWPIKKEKRNHNAILESIYIRYQILFHFAISAPLERRQYVGKWIMSKLD